MSQRIRNRLRVVAAAALLATSASAPAAEQDAPPKGHYLSFGRERDLQAELLDVLAEPHEANDYQLRVAHGLEAALQTPGVEGLYMHFDWRTLEPADGVYDWRLVDANMTAARKYGLLLIVQVSDRSFDGSDILPEYFPSEYVLESSGHGNSGVVAKRWDPYVYTRLIRLYEAIAKRYANEPAFGGIATAETATGNFSGGDYSIDAYRRALTEILTKAQAALTRGGLFFYLNFLKDGTSIDMNKDVRVQLLADVPHDRLIVGAPDITPDAKGMQGSVNSYRIHVRKTIPSLRQFCHLQHADQGLNGINVKSNEYRERYRDKVADARERESQSWFSGTPAVFEFDDLREADTHGIGVELHPSSELGELWKPAELLDFGVRNFGCDYVFWHYREWSIPGGFDWPDIQTVIESNQCFYDEGGCGQVSLRDSPRAPLLK